MCVCLFFFLCLNRALGKTGDESICVWPGDRNSIIVTLNLGLKGERGLVRHGGKMGGEAKRQENFKK